MPTMRRPGRDRCQRLAWPERTNCRSRRRSASTTAESRTCGRPIEGWGRCIRCLVPLRVVSVSTSLSCSVACPPKFGSDVIRPALSSMLSMDRWSLRKRCTACITISPKQRLIVTSTRTTVPEARMVAGRMDDTGASSLTDGPQRGVSDGPLAFWRAQLRFIGNTRPCRGVLVRSDQCLAPISSRTRMAMTATKRMADARASFLYWWFFRLSSLKLLCADMSRVPR